MNRNIARKFTTRALALILAFTLAFGLSACTGKDEPEPLVPVEPPKVDPDDPTAKLTLTEDELPVIDGATAMLPYYQEMVARLLGTDAESVKDKVMCSTTAQAYDNLAAGTVDMIFCAPPSQEQIDHAKYMGVEFESAEVLNSGFVFFVNKSNPVSNLTSQQLHDIYAGKITNWKEVGGENEPIIAYQRSEGSGSQTGLYQHVIPQNEVMEPPMVQRLGAMSEIIDAVANYDNAKGALGYSYYYYVTNMHYQEDVKLIAIDNIYPTPDTITSDMYPFISKTCAIFNSNEAEDSTVRKIAAWCHGSAGTAMAAELGYVPSGESYIVPGYGNSFRTHEPVYMIKGNLIDTETVYVDPNQYGYSATSYIRISGLKDKAVEKKINDVIYGLFDYYINQNHISDPDDGFDIPDGASTDVYCYAEVTANYANILSMYLSLSNSARIAQDEYIYFNRYIPLNFDLRTGEQLSVRDLFNDGDNGMEFLNAAVCDKINDGNYMEEDDTAWWDYNRFLVAAPFTGLRDSQKFYLTGNGNIALIIDADTPEFYVSDQLAVLQIDGKCIIDFDKFASEESLFEEDSLSCHLFNRPYEGAGTPVDLTEMIKDMFPEDGRIHVYSSAEVYDEMTEAQKNAYFDHKDEIRETAQMFLSDAKAMEKDGEIFADGSIRAYAMRFGRFTNVFQSFDGSLYAVENGYWMDGTHYNYISNKVYEDGNDTPLELEDIFADGVDYKAAIAEGIYKSLASSKNEINKDEAFLRDMAGDAAENIIAFGLQADEMIFYYIDDNALIRDHIQDPSKENELWMYASCITNVPYSCLDCRNLKIFMLK